MELVTTTDAHLTTRVATGESAALSELFDRHAPTVTRYAWAMVESRMDVEEIVQDTFMTLWTKARELETRDGSLLPWLLVVCRNHALNLRRKRQRTAGYELPIDLATPSDESQHEAEQLLRYVRDEISALGAIDRRICELCLLEGRSYAEAAVELGLTVGAVTQRVSRNRSRLRKAVRTDEY